MKFSLLRTVALPPLSRQLTTSTIGNRTGSTPASLTPRTRARDVPPWLSQVGSTNEVPAAVGTISVSLPPTWNWVAVLLTQAARAGGGKANETTTRRKPATTPQLRTLPLFISLPATFVRIPGISPPLTFVEIIAPSISPFLGQLKIAPYLHGSSPLINHNTPQASFGGRGALVYAASQWSSAHARAWSLPLRLCVVLGNQLPNSRHKFVWHLHHRLCRLCNRRLVFCHGFVFGLLFVV